jgi:hypothetical protein
VPLWKSIVEFEPKTKLGVKSSNTKVDQVVAAANEIVILAPLAKAVVGAADIANVVPFTIPVTTLLAAKAPVPLFFAKAPPTVIPALEDTGKVNLEVEIVAALNCVVAAADATNVVLLVILLTKVPAGKTPAPEATVMISPTCKLEVLEQVTVLVNPVVLAEVAAVALVLVELAPVVEVVTGKTETLVVVAKPPGLPALKVPLMVTNPPARIPRKFEEAPIGPDKVQPLSIVIFLNFAFAPPMSTAALFIKLRSPNEFVELEVMVAPSNTISKFGS